MGGSDSIEFERSERSLPKILVTAAVVFVLVATIGVAALVKPAADSDNSVQTMSAGNRVLRIGWVGMMNEISTLNPLLYTSSAEWAAIWPCYSTLLTYDEDSNVIGGLAKSWTMSEDGLSWSFKLYDTASFYDRNNPSVVHPATARDVIYTYNLVQNVTECNLHWTLPEVDGAPIIQSITGGPTLYDLQITLSSPYAPFYSSMLTIPILPMYVWVNYYDPATHKTAWNWNNFATGISPCIGSGFLYYNQAGLPTTGIIEFGRNPTWFGIEEHGWKLRCNKVVYYSELNPSTALTGFQNGIIDIMEWCTPDQFINSLPLVPGTILQTSNSGFVYEYNANQMTDAMRKSLGGVFRQGSNNQLLLDPVVKEALAMTVDRQAFIDTVTLGLGSPADSLVPMSNPYHYTYGSDPSDVPVSYDPSAARILLNTAGWTYDQYGNHDPSATPLCKFGGTDPLRFRFETINIASEWNLGAMLLANAASQAGIDLWTYYSVVNIAEMNIDWYYADYDVWLWNWIFSPVSDVSTDILSVMTTDMIGTWSDVFYSNATFDALFEQSLVTIDPVQRKVITDEMQRMVYEDHGCQAVAYRDDLFAMKASAPDNWGNWGEWSSHWTLEPSQGHPWLYLRIQPADNPAPIVTSMPSVINGIVNEPVFFTASATDSGALEYRWIFGDGSKSAWSPSPTASHIYASDGHYSASINVREAASADGFITSANTHVAITSSNSAPHSLSISHTPVDPDTGTIVSLHGSAADDELDPLTYSWDFGDGWTAQGQNATHQFVGGSSTVTLFVDDGHLGFQPRPSILMVFVSVSSNSPPTLDVPNFPFVMPSQETDFWVSFSDPDSRDTHMFSWFWGDGISSSTTEPNATHVYMTDGVYNLTVFCDDLTGLVGHNVSSTGVVSVGGMNHPPSIESFWATSIAPTVYQSVIFTCTASDEDNDVLNITFDFGDGTTFSAIVTSNPVVNLSTSHAYSAPGTYYAYATATDYISSPVISAPIVMAVSPWKLHLVAGWNLISLPFVNHSYTAQTMGLMTGDVVIGWNSASRSYDRTCIVGISPPSTDFPIEDSTGYWIHTSMTRDITIIGSLPPATMTRSVTVPAGGGWVLMGFAGLSTQRHASNVPAWYSGGSVSVVVRYVPGIIYQTYIPGLPFSDFTLVPGEGYWVYVTASGTFTYPTSSGIVIQSG